MKDECVEITTLVTCKWSHGFRDVMTSWCVWGLRSRGQTAGERWHLWIYRWNRELTAICCYMFCSSAILDPRVGHTMNVLSPFISVLCHSDWLFDGESCPRLFVVHPGCAWSFSPACTWHCSLHCLNSLVFTRCDHSMLASLLWQSLIVPSLLQLCWGPIYLARSANIFD